MPQTRQLAAIMFADIMGFTAEWCANQSNNPSQRFILGGGWNDPTYAFNDSYTQNGLDRSATNGFRCIQEITGDTTILSLTVPLKIEFRDYTKEQPVHDKTYDMIARQYAYDKIPLNAHIDLTIEGGSWTVEKIPFDAAYNEERMLAFLFPPKNGKPPIQIVVFFGGSGDIYKTKFDIDNGLYLINFLLKSGRAVICPVYKGTNERHDNLKSDEQDKTVFYKDHVIMWSKDIGRTIDYLETRKDIQADKIGYPGWSWGGFMGGIMPAIEKRFKAVVLNVGGMEMSKALPEADQINFLPRVTQPVLMLNGEHDMFFRKKQPNCPCLIFWVRLRRIKRYSFTNRATRCQELNS